MIRLIAATDNKRGVAKNGKQPKTIPSDLKYFASQTKTHGGLILVGGNTFRNDFHGKSLKDRTTIVLSKSLKSTGDIYLAHSLDEALEIVGKRDLWVVGGASIFNQCVESGNADELYLTKIEADFECDQFFPDYESKYSLQSQSQTYNEEGFSFSYCIYKKK